MRWTRQRRRANGVRTNDEAADGEAVWSWRSDAGVQVREDALRVSRAMVATKPGHQGERGVSVKTTAQGVPGVSAYLW